MTITPVIREALPTDIEQLLAIERRVFTDPWTRSQIEFELLKQPVALNLVACMNEIVIGYLLSYLVVDELHLNNLAVDNDFQKQGVAAGLMQEMFNRLEATAVKHCYLEVAVTNSGAIAFYRRWGFDQVAIRKNYYHTGEDALVMVKGL